MNSFDSNGNYKAHRVGIFAHIDSGKTTFVERTLYDSRVITHFGSIEEGTTESDTDPDEIERGISIYSSLFSFPWKINSQTTIFEILDTPGHLDFRSQVNRILHVTDLAIVLLDGTQGVQSQTHLLLQSLIKQNIPIIYFLNKMDCENPLVLEILIELEETLESCPRILLEHHENDWIPWLELPNTQKESVLLRALAGNLEWEGLYLDSPKKALLETEQAFAEEIFCKHTPYVWGGSAKTGKNTKSFWDFVTSVFLTQSHSTNKIKNNLSVTTPIGRSFTQEGERFSWGILGEDSLGKEFLSKASCKRIQGLDWETVPYVPFGEVFYHKGLVDIPLAFSFPKGEFGVQIEPVSVEFKKSLWKALCDITWEDSGFQTTTREDLGNWILWGQGELHLELGLQRLERRVSGQFNFGEIKVASCELYKNMEKKVTFEHNAHDGSVASGVFGGILEETTDFNVSVEFTTDLPSSVRIAVATAFHEALAHGNFNEEVKGLHLRISSYEPPSGNSTFLLPLVKVAILAGMKQLLRENTRLVGPSSKIQVLVPSSDASAVIGELQRRNCKIEDVMSKDRAKTQIQAKSATQNLLGFSGALRNMTKGTGFFSQEISFSPTCFFILKEKPR